MNKRPINFRIRVGDKFYYINNLNGKNVFSFDFSGCEQEITWQLCTQEKDCKGNLVYEGDILNCIVGLKEFQYEVKFGSFEGWECKGHGFYLQSTDNDIDKSPAPFHTGVNKNRFEIVGTIFDLKDREAVKSAKDLNPYDQD